MYISFVWKRDKKFKAYKAKICYITQYKLKSGLYCEKC